MREKRTDVDWSKHKLTVTTGETLIHRLCIPNRISQSIKFINAYPSRSGFLRCVDDIGDEGYDTVEEFDKDNS